MSERGCLVSEIRALPEEPCKSSPLGLLSAMFRYREESPHQSPDSLEPWAWT